MPTSITSATPLSAQLVRAQFSGPIRPCEGSDFLIGPTTEGASVVIYHVALEGDGASALLYLAPGTSLGATYALSPTSVIDTSGAPVLGSASFAGLESPALPTSGPLEAITAALGLEAQNLAGEPTTRLLASFDPLRQSTLYVESVLGFPPSGAVWVDGRLIHYGRLSPSGSALLECYEWPPNGITINSGALVSVSLALAPTQGPSFTPSVIEQGRRATLITHAPAGDELDRLAQIYGLPRADAFPSESWRKALLATAQQPRGTPGQILGFLLGALDHLALRFPEVQLSPLDPHALWSLGEAFPDVAEALIEIEYLPASALPLHPNQPPPTWPRVKDLFWILGRDPGNPQRLLLAPTRTAYFNGARWDKAPTLIDPAYATGSAKILGFVVTRDDAARFALSLSATTTTPPSYLLSPAGVDRATILPTPPPEGSILLESPASSPLDYDNPPAPIYFDGPESSPLAIALGALLAAGVVLDT